MHRLLAPLLFILCLGAPALAHDVVVQGVSKTVSGWPIAAFTLTDLQGKPFTQDNLQGRWTFVLFGDTQCGRECTDALAALDGLYKRIAGADALKATQVVFIALDPQRDTPARIREYLRPFDARFIGSTGPPATLARLADDMGLADDAAAASASSPDHDHDREHRRSLLLIGPDSVVRVRYVAPYDVLRLTSHFMRTRSRR